MPRKKKQENKSIPLVTNVQQVIDEYDKELDNNTELSIDVDPTNQYNLSDEHRRFIQLYVEYKNVNLVSSVMGLDTEQANAYFTAYSTRQEIRRINRALYHRQFKHKMMTIDDIAGYLSAIVMDEVPYADRVSTMDKVSISRTLIDLNKFKAEAMQKPELVMYTDIEEQVKDMSIETIRAMLNVNPADVNKEKQDIIQKLNPDNALTIEEIDYLKTLSTKDLLQLLDNLSKQSTEKK